MRIGNFGKYSFGGQEEPGFSRHLFQVGSAAKIGRNFHRRRLACKIGRLFSDSQKKPPEVIHPLGISEKIRIGIKNMNDWAPAGGLAFAIIGAIVFDQCRATQMASDLKNLEKRFDKVDERFDKVDERFDKVDERFDKLAVKLEKIESKLDKVDKIALITYGSYGFAYFLFKLNEARAHR